MAIRENDSKEFIPIIFFKNPSAGHTDPYTSHFVSGPPSSPNSAYEPLYVPVLEHTSNTGPILDMLSQLSQSKIPDQAATAHFSYGGLIFTSQRAVEAFASALDSIRPDDVDELSETPLVYLRQLTIPLYAVGPATARSLEEIQKKYVPCCWIRGGEQAGTGELLSKLILQDYNGLWNPETARQKKPLLFLTGAKHRDIVPATLMSAPDDQRIEVQTLVVYATSESPAFASDITNTLNATSNASIRWLIIFSPTGGESLLRALGWLSDSNSKSNLRRANPGTFIATIGPTTRDYMRTTFDFSVDVCAETPSPEGVRNGIEDFMRTQLQQPLLKTFPLLGAPRTQLSDDTGSLCQNSIAM
ncbi:MAG: hypothetical protein L6R38_006072 [Xanthoria sp. 2 TBL-2021]|nr:MAG: hypothetical protein L6R38_006072 [Xanthoria sp. 2 TBL-2021]